MAASARPEQQSAFPPVSEVTNLTTEILERLVRHGRDPRLRREITVAKSTPVHGLAQTIAKAICEERQDVFVTAVGEEANQQAFKGIVEANRYTAQTGRVILVRPFLADDIGRKHGEPISVNVYQILTV